MTRSPSRLSTILSSICTLSELFYYLLVVESLLLLLSLFSLLFIDRNSSFVVLVFSFALLVPLFVLTVGIIYKCRSSFEDKSVIE
jgi:hypothetical protein